MNVRDALLGAEERGQGFAAVCGETQLVPFIGRISTSFGGGTYKDYQRYFRGRAPIGAQNYMSFDELISNEWQVIEMNP